MHFSEAKDRYDELEQQLVNGELSEEEFLQQVEQFRLVDTQGRRWRLSASTGEWLGHDGQQWVLGEPSGEAMEVEFDEYQELLVDPEDAASASGTNATLIVPASSHSTVVRPLAPRHIAARAMAVGVVGLIFLCCVLGGGVGVWVLFLREIDGGLPDTPVATEVGFVPTYTVRPATATYTPTPTPTPSRSPTPSITPISTDTPVVTATNTGLPPTATSPPQPSATPTTSAVPLDTNTPAPAAPQTYKVKQGETLSEIAARFGIETDALAGANGITNAALISIGQVLVIPPAGGLPTPTWTAIALITPTWTPILVTTATTQATAAPTALAAATATPTTKAAANTPAPTRSGPTATPKPKPTSTPKPASLSGKMAFAIWNAAKNKWELYVSLVNGSGRNMLGEGFRQPQFRPDGNLLVANGEGAPNYEHLVVMDPNGGGLTEVSNHSEDSYPSWRADGAIVAYSSDSWGDGRTRVGTVHDMAGKSQDWVPLGASQIEGHFPFWMADGRIVYQGCDSLGGGGNCGLYWVGAGGGNYHQVSNHESDSAPAGSGGNVAFMSARDGNWEIYRTHIDSGGTKRLTNNAAIDGLPTWSPDGSSIAFVSNRGGPWAIWVMNANGSNQRKLFDLDGSYGGGGNAWNFERISWGP